MFNDYKKPLKVKTIPTENATLVSLARPHNAWLKTVILFILFATLGSVKPVYARTWLTLCNVESDAISMAMAFDQAYESQPKSGSERYASQGWRTIESGSCFDEAVPLGDGQWVYFAFYGKNGSLILKTQTSGRHAIGKGKYKTICVNPNDGFKITAPDWKGITINCPGGYDRIETSFGLRGGGDFDMLTIKLRN